METELQRETNEGISPTDSFILTFSFESGFECLGKALQDIQEVIFDTTKPKVECALPTWDVKMKDIVNCWNFWVEDNEEDPRNITILEYEEHRPVFGPFIESLYVTKPMNIRQVNIGSKEQLKWAKIGDYSDDDTVGKVTELLMEYHELFPAKFFELKGIVGNLGLMNITLKPDAQPVK